MNRNRFFALIIGLFSCLLLINAHAAYIPKIVNKPIKFTAERIALTKQYLRIHYDINSTSIKIIPRMIVLHWTVTPNWQSAYKIFYPIKTKGRPYLLKYGALNVSVPYLVARDGTIYHLMPTSWMGRHVIGLNYLAIGIENVGGMGGRQDLTQAQVRADVYLIRLLKSQYPTIKYLIGHYEYGHFKHTKLWKEKFKNYFTHKIDPGPKFMRAVRARVKNLGLLPRKTYPDPGLPKSKSSLKIGE